MLPALHFHPPMKILFSLQIILPIEVKEEYNKVSKKQEEITLYYIICVIEERADIFNI
jgi:hypothetical protein